MSLEIPELQRFHELWIRFVHCAHDTIVFPHSQPLAYHLLLKPHLNVRNESEAISPFIAIRAKTTRHAVVSVSDVNYVTSGNYSKP
jgi:hypothetical protein